MVPRLQLATEFGGEVLARASCHPERRQCRHQRTALSQQNNKVPVLVIALDSVYPSLAWNQQLVTAARVETRHLKFWFLTPSLSQFAPRTRNPRATKSSKGERAAAESGPLAHRRTQPFPCCLLPACTIHHPHPRPPAHLPNFDPALDPRRASPGDTNERAVDTNVIAPILRDRRRPRRAVI